MQWALIQDGWPGKNPHRVESDRTSESRRWRIKAPAAPVRMTP